MDAGADVTTPVDCLTVDANTEQPTNSSDAKPYTSTDVEMKGTELCVSITLNTINGIFRLVK